MKILNTTWAKNLGVSTNVCFKKTKTNRSSVSLLRIVLYNIFPTVQRTRTMGTFPHPSPMLLATSLNEFSSINWISVVSILSMDLLCIW